MSAIVKQLPGKLDFQVSKRDGLSKLLDFDINLTGYTFAAAVIQKDTNVETTITVTDTDLATGQITISLTNALISALGTGTHEWYLVWTVSGTPRHILGGDFVVV